MSKLSTFLAAHGISELLGPRPGYLSIEGAAHYASVSTRTIKRWITQGLPTYQGSVRGKVLIKPGDIDAFLEKKAAPKVDLSVMVDEVMQSLAPTGKQPASQNKALGPQTGKKRSRPSVRWQHPCNQAVTETDNNET